MSDGHSNDPMIVDVLGPCPVQGQWIPLPGPETAGLVLPEHARGRIVEEASRVLGRCVPPTAEDGAETGLVIGYVQSGKTTSFITLAALARQRLSYRHCNRGHDETSVLPNAGSLKCARASPRLPPPQ